ncbi:MAG TPA: DUF4388 domain-containing protein, partial [Thermodesulfovibrionales bacterium]|nr:DUF4388 domain-containing protein [Thermodesulfovibrionales bacterium]
SSDKKDVKACVTDYSLKGFGFYIESPSLLLPDQNVHFIIRDLDIEADGKIVWSRKSQLRLEGGIERKDISGRLRNYPLADVLLDLQRSERDGIFEVTRDSITKKIYFKNGDMVYAASNTQGDRFTEVLLRNRKITEDQHYQVTDISRKTGKSQGSVLVKLGFLKRTDLIVAVREQVEQIILSLFQWEDGEFTFIEGPAVPEKLIALKLDAERLIYEGIKKMKSTEILAKALPPDDSILLHCSADPMSLLGDILVEKKPDEDILNSVDGSKRISDIVAGSPQDFFETRKIIYALLKARVIDVKEEGWHEQAAGEAGPEQARDPDFLKRVDEIFSRLDDTDYYSFLNIERSASTASIKKAYYEAAKEFHPDKHLHLPPGALRNKLNTIFSHLTEVYKVLSSPGERRQYDNSLAARPAKVHIDNKELGRIRFTEGEKAFDKGDYSAASGLFGQAVYLDKSVPRYHYNLGLAFAKAGKFSQAAKALNEAIRLEPHNVAYLAEVGYVYLRLGFHLRAKSTFEKALRIDPSNKAAAKGLKESSGEKG